MLNSTKRTRFKYAATLLGAMAIFALAPATAHAVDNEPAPGGGCNYTDADGYNIPIDEGQDVFVDGKIVSCRDGKIVITTAPKRGIGNVRSPLVTKNAPVFSVQP
jgi:hypothetical protein